MSEHVMHPQGSYVAPRPRSGAGAREYTAQGESLAAGQMASQNALNLDAQSRYAADHAVTPSNVAGAFSKGATFGWVDEMQNPPPWLTEFKDIYQHLLTYSVAHGAGELGGRYFGRQGGRMVRRFAHSYFQKRFMKRSVHKQWASAFHGR